MPSPQGVCAPTLHWLDALERGCRAGLWEGHQEGLLGYVSLGLVLEEAQKTEEGAGLGGDYGGLWEHCQSRSALGVLRATRRRCRWAGWGPLHRVPVWNFPGGGI